MAQAQRAPYGSPLFYDGSLHFITVRKLNNTPQAHMLKHRTLDLYSKGQNMKCDKLTMKMSLCWGTAIICAAMFDAPEFFTLILLPILAFTSITNAKK